MTNRKTRALVSEGTALGRWALIRTLEGQGFEVHAGPTWVEASASLGGADFGLALLAVESGLENAADIVAHLRRHHPDTRLILLADRDDVPALRLACGPEPAILAKPIDLAQVVLAARPHREPCNQALRA